MINRRNFRLEIISVIWLSLFMLSFQVACLAASEETAPAWTKERAILELDALCIIGDDKPNPPNRLPHSKAEWLDNGISREDEPWQKCRIRQSAE